MRETNLECLANTGVNSSGPTPPNTGEQRNEKTPLLAKDARNGAQIKWTKPELKTRGLALLFLSTKLQRSYFPIGAPFVFPVTPWIKGRPFGSPNPVTLSHPSSTVREVSAPNAIAKDEWSW